MRMRTLSHPEQAVLFDYESTESQEYLHAESGGQLQEGTSSSHGCGCFELQPITKCQALTEIGLRSFNRCPSFTLSAKASSRVAQ